MTAFRFACESKGEHSYTPPVLVGPEYIVVCQRCGDVKVVYVVKAAQP